MAMIRPETEMKDSGVQWIGDIPSSWTIFPANGVFSEVKEKNMDLKLTNAFSFKYGEIVDKKQVGDVDNNLKETLSSYTIVRKNTIMINGLNLNYDFVSQRVAIVNESGVITSAYLAIQPDENKINPRFVLYLLKSYDYQQVFHGLGSGIRKTLKYQDFKKIMIVAPTLSKQQAIADYLDETCSKIDEIIAEAKASIDEYKELKQAVIFEAVTKGLDKNVEMKQCSVNWLDEIPSTWESIRLKYLLTEINNRSETGTEQPLSVSQVMGVVPSYMIAVANPTASYVGQKIVEPNDIVFNKLKAHLGVFFMSKYHGLVSPDYAVYRTNDKVIPKYLEYLFHTSACISEFKKYISGVAEGLMRLYTSDLFNIRICLPKVDEQIQIVEYVENKVELFDSLITEKESLINDLEAYKKSLIYEVVTGKRRVV